MFWPSCNHCDINTKATQDKLYFSPRSTAESPIKRHETQFICTLLLLRFLYSGRKWRTFVFHSRLSRGTPTNPLRLISCKLQGDYTAYNVVCFPVSDICDVMNLKARGNHHLSHTQAGGISFAVHKLDSRYFSCQSSFFGKRRNLKRENVESI